LLTAKNAVIDGEIAALGPNGKTSFQLLQTALRRNTKPFLVSLNGDYSTHRFTWSPESVYFQSLHGHHDDNSNQFFSWLFQPSTPTSYVSQKPMPVRINLWCCKGQPPRNAESVELVVRSFEFTPR
jgi:hypothetical protein